MLKFCNKSVHQFSRRNYFTKCVVTPGTGRLYPRKGDILWLEYTARIIETGEIFDQSERLKLLQFQVGNIFFWEKKGQGILHEQKKKKKRNAACTFYPLNYRHVA